MPIHTFQEHLTCFSNVDSITFCTLELIHQVGKFTVSKRGDEIRQVNDWVEMWMGTVCRGFGGEGMRVDMRV